MDIKKMTGDELIGEIRDTLAQWDGQDLAEIAERILGHRVTYEGNFLYSVNESARPMPDDDD